MTHASRHTDLPLLLALLPLAVLLATIAGGVALSGFGGEILIVAMALAALSAGLIARSRGTGWADIQAAAGAKIADVLPAILILLSIGVLLGAWMFSGTIPLMVVTGIALIDPGYIVLTAFIGTALMSIMTGTSWGSAGTLGVAFIATAEAMGLPLAPVAGAIVSGAYFGDKLSPLSDTDQCCRHCRPCPGLQPYPPHAVDGRAVLHPGHPDLRAYRSPRQRVAMPLRRRPHRRLPPLWRACSGSTHSPCSRLRWPSAALPSVSRRPW